ncbi:MAG: hypothetical protein LBB50_02025 [Oscillospiraceae bacterium]|jgi:hypothetical protein|nr:hypothetical protein [Oscillospiraceae bacterium]
MTYYIYYAHQKIGQMFRQLPESRCVAQKNSFSSSMHGDLDFRPQDCEGKPSLLAHAGADGSRVRYCESVLDKNDMYQLARVLAHLRRAGRLCGAKEAPFVPGKYYEVVGDFAPEESAQAPEGCLWLHAPAAGGRPATHLLCSRQAFWGEGTAAWQEPFACGAPLPLHGAALCLRAGKNLLCGLPLALGI